MDSLFFLQHNKFILYFSPCIYSFYLLCLNALHDERFHATRSQRKKEDIKNENFKSMEGMRDFREFGRLKNFEKRSKKNKSEISDWKEYFEKGEKYSSFLQGKKPDLIEIVNQEIREEKEREREKREQERKKKEEKDKKRKEGEWEYNGEQVSGIGLVKKSQL